MSPPKRSVESLTLVLEHTDCINSFADLINRGQFTTGLTWPKPKTHTEKSSTISTFLYRDHEPWLSKSFSTNNHHWRKKTPGPRCFTKKSKIHSVPSSGGPRQYSSTLASSTLLWHQSTQGRKESSLPHPTAEGARSQGVASAADFCMRPLHETSVNPFSGTAPRT